MLERKDIAVNMKLVTTQEHEFEKKNSKRFFSQIFPAGTIFTLSFLGKDTRLPAYTLKHEDGTNWTGKNLHFDNLLKIMEQYGTINEADKKSHEDKQYKEKIIKKIKKLAEKDDLSAIKKIFNEDETFLTDKRLCKTLMAYAIRSKTTDILNEGFSKNWFKTVDWNETLITGELIAAPLSYAIQKSSEEVIKTLMLNGADAENKCWGGKDDKETVKTALYKGFIYSDISFEQLEQYENMKKKVDSKNKLEKQLIVQEKNNIKHKL